MSTARLPRVLVAVAAALQACSDSTGNDPVVTASAIAGGDGQSALVGTTLPRPLQVHVRSGDLALAGAIVVWEPSSGGLTITSSATDSNGVASARWTLGNGPGPARVTATVQGAAGSPVTFTATALGWVTATIDPDAENQHGEVGSTLPRQLRVQAFADGAPAEGVPVTWSTTDGSVSPRSTVTDADGHASTYWVLPRTPGVVSAQATVDRRPGTPLNFNAIAQPGPAAELHMRWGGGQTIPANVPEFGALVVGATDQFGNDIVPLDVTWTVVDGPVRILPPYPDNPQFGRVAPTGASGTATVRAAVGTAPWVDFGLAVVAPGPLAVFDQGERTFTSAQNGSMPAVDTIPIGGSMIWLWIGQSYSYDDEGVTSVGDPSFLGGLFGSNASTYTATFPAAGTYLYTDLYHSGATGTVVVR